MCLQDIAISRSATIRRTALPVGMTPLRLPPDPDRIAVTVVPYDGATARVWLSEYDATNNLTYRTNEIVGQISGLMVGVTDTFTVSLLTDAVRQPVRMSAADDPGVISDELMVGQGGGVEGYVLETILSPDVSRAIQELI